MIKTESRLVVHVDVSNIEWIQKQPLPFDRVIRSNDRILFVGDELTQQKLYTRATATAFLGLMPHANLRFFNGGQEGATAAQATQWIGDLLDLTRPTVVFICLGLNESEAEGSLQQKVAAYRSGLSALIDSIRSGDGADARRIVVLSSPAVFPGTPGTPESTGKTSQPTRTGRDEQNRTLRTLAVAAMETARDKGVDFADLFAPMLRVYEAIKRSGRQHVPLTRNGRLPNRNGHVVLASMVLYGIGVDRERLDAVGWSPLVPRRMGGIRGILGLDLKTPPIDAAQRSRVLYNSLVEFDEMFFEAWRLAPRRLTGPDRAEVMAKAEKAWEKVRRIVAGGSDEGWRKEG